INIIRFTLHQQEQVIYFLNEIQEELEKKQAAYETCVQALFKQFLIFISRYVHKQYVDQPFSHPTLIHQKVSQIVRYINTHFMDYLTLEDVAQRFYTSPSYLSRIFKQATGFTFIEYINNVRIKEAQVLLNKTDSKV